MTVPATAAHLFFGSGTVCFVLTLATTRVCCSLSSCFTALRGCVLCATELDSCLATCSKAVSCDFSTSLSSQTVFNYLKSHSHVGKHLILSDEHKQ